MAVVQSVLAFVLTAVTVFSVARSAEAEAFGPLVDADWLATHLATVVVLDVREEARSFEKEGHIPGARLVAWGEVRGEAREEGVLLKDMLPSRGDFERVMRRAGVGTDSRIVVTSRGLKPEEMFLATRLYWQIKYFGHDAVAVLNGGTGAWSAQGHRLGTGPYKAAKPGDWQSRSERRELLAQTQDVTKALAARSPVLADARNIEAYLGFQRNLARVSRPGHIPAAKHADARYFILDAKPVLFRPVTELRQIVKGLGIDPAAPVIAYCDTGDWASGAWFVLHELLGNRSAALYDGSMHAWTQKEERGVTRFKLD